jgi:serine/threonine-protein kinase
LAELSRELWAVVAPLLDQALDLPPDERASFVDQVRVDSPIVASELETLLAVESTPVSEFLDQPPAPELQGRGLAGQSVGKYTLDRPLGQGGMASVWLAHRTDGRFEGQVAVKLLNLALVGRAGEERFAQEGNLLARLTHPRIARLLDAGVTSGGQPFLVLEYVVGQRLDRFADDRRYSPLQRIALVSDVLDALASAHANLIIHRDIKPSNILVSDDGGVKLLDFGIAKLLLEGRSTAGPDTLTDVAGRALTPEYAAPEVILGDPVSAATDVYSAGVLLYLMLSGRHPTGAEARTPAQHLRSVLDVEPMRLSTAVTAGDPDDVAGRAEARGISPERLKRFCTGDLDNILARALKKRAADRYQTIAEFADDLNRFRRHEPVSARPDSWGYRAGKFVRRHRAAVLAASLAVLSLVAATVVSLQGLESARRERDRAASALRRSRATSSFETLLFRLIDESGAPLTFRQLMDKGRLVLDQQYRGDPIGHMQLDIEFKQNYLRVNEFEAADTVIRRAVRTADSLGDNRWRAETRCHLAFVLAKRHFPDSSLGLVNLSRGLIAGLSEPDNATLNACDNGQSEAFMAMKKPDSAARLLARVEARLVQSGDSTSEEYLNALNDLGRAFFAAHDNRGSLALEHRVLAAGNRGAFGDPQDFPIVIHNTAQVYEVLGEWHDEQLFFQHESSMIQHFDSLTPNTLVAYDYGMLLALLGEKDSARVWLNKALRIPEPLGLPRVYAVNLVLARMAIPPAEQAEFRKAALKAVPPGGKLPPSALALTAEDQIETAARQTDPGRLSQLIKTALDSAGFTPKATSRFLMTPLAAAATALINVHKFDEAAEYADQIVRIGTVDSLSVQQSGIVGRGLLLGAQAAAGKGDRTHARDLARRAVTPLRFGLGISHPLTIRGIAFRDSLER